MNILVLTSVYKDLSIGARDTSTNIVNSFVSDWIKQGHNVVVIHNSHCYPRLVHSIPASLKKKIATRISFSIADYDAVKEKKYMDSGATIYRIPIRKWIPHKTPSNKAIKKQINKIVSILQDTNFVPDVITGHWASPQMEIISELKKIYDCKTACVLHGTGYISDSSFDAKKYLQHIDHVGCRSISQARKVKEILNLNELPFVCYSGVPDIYLNNYEVSTEKYNNTSELVVSYVGRLVSYKNIDATIRALTSIKGLKWRFNIVGDGAEKKNLIELTKKLRCEENVKFWGKIPRDDVMNILKDTQVFIMISTNEIFGLVYLEAMAASCLTIASKDGGVDGIIVHGQNGFLCEEGNSVELEKIIKNHIMSEKISKLQEIAENGYDTAIGYSDAKVAARYLETILKD